MREDGGDGNQPIRPGGAARRRLLLAVAAVVVAPLLGCVREGEARAAGEAARPVFAVATTGMVADAVAEVGGERVHVAGLMGPGVDPHLYKARAGDVRRVAAADVIFYNGLHLEAAMGEVFEEMAGRTRTVAVAEAIPEGRRLAPAEFAGAWDPHVWFDVRLWMTIVPQIEAALAAEDPAGAATYAANARAYLARLDALDRWARARVAELPPDRRVLVTAHDAFNYFGRAYGFEVHALQGISTVAEAGTGDVQRLADFIAARRLPAIFVESSIPRRTVEAVQAAVRARGHEVRIGGSLYSDALGSAGTPAARYEGMVRHNVNVVVDALLGAPVVAAGAAAP